MEKRFESWFRDQRIDWQSCYPNPSNPLFFLGHQNVTSLGNIMSLNVATNGVHKKFLVFDRCGGHTRLIGETPIKHHLTFRKNPKLEISNENPAIKKVKDPSYVDEYIEENNVDDVTQEDTEELNALLYSDDDEEETSTAHSPTLTGQREPLDEIAEDVASSVGPTKRRKLESGAHDVIPLEDVSCSAKSCINCSNDEESSEEVSSCGYEGSRNKIVREIISIFQDLVPGGKNGKKDALMVIDEAIDYLTSLKVKKAKALGLDSL